MFSTIIKYTRIQILLAGMLIIAGCSQKETTVIIFHTNDSHAMIDNFPALAYLVNEERKVNENVLLVSAGDIFSGNPMVDYYDPQGYPKIDLMNRVGYDLNTIGNHEFDYGIETLIQRMEQADFPFILANLNADGSGLPQPDPFHTIKAGRRKIVFFGLVQLNSRGIPSAHPDNMQGIEFFQPVEMAAGYEFLSEKADAVVALTHHGFVSDTIMAYMYPWIDVIIGGHSHTLTLEPRTWNDVLITQAGSNLQYIGKVTLVFRGRELTGKSAEMISLGSVGGIDEEIAALVKEYNENPVLNRIIGRLARPLDGKPEIGGFITDAYREYGNFDFAIHNYGGIRIERMEGDVTIRDIFRMDPFGNELVSMELDYSEFRELIENSISARNTPTVQISGGTIEVHLTGDNRLNGIKIFNENDIELSEGVRYLVGMPSYIASAFDFGHTDPGFGMGIITAQVVIDHISRIRDIDFNLNERSRVIRHQY